MENTPIQGELQIGLPSHATFNEGAELADGLGELFPYSGVSRRNPRFPGGGPNDPWAIWALWITVAAWVQTTGLTAFGQKIFELLAEDLYRSARNRVAGTARRLREEHPGPPPTVVFFDIHAQQGFPQEEPSRLMFRWLPESDEDLDAAIAAAINVLQDLRDMPGERAWRWRGGRWEPYLRPGPGRAGADED